MKSSQTSEISDIKLHQLLPEVRRCNQCPDLPLGPRPVVQASESAKILIIGQAPGTRVHETGIPWNDPSGCRLREWMGVEPERFYDPTLFAIMPMGFCYPGKGRSGDLPPRPECAPLWHNRLRSALPNVELTLLVGQFAMKYYLGKEFSTVTKTVEQYDHKSGAYFPLVHPSPRNRLWLKKNPWFEESVVPKLRDRIDFLLI